MEDFLKHILESDRSGRTVLKDYVTGKYTVKNCPFTEYEYGIGPDGETAYILANVMYRIGEILQEMREKGITECEYHEK